MDIVTIEGVVVKGRQLGRELGFPTANISLAEGVEVESGVYRSVVLVLGREYCAVTNVGVNPTINGVGRHAESYLFDFSQDIYGEKIKVELHERLRGEQRFESVEQLREQIARDVERVRRSNNLIKI